MKIIPYVEIDGCWTLKDSVMKGFYNRIKEDGNVEKLFWRNPIPTEWGWINFCKNKENLFFTLWTDDERPIQMVWLNGIYKKSAFIHIYSFKEAKYSEKLNSFREFLKYLKPVFNILIGLIPEYFQKAIIFAHGTGFKDSGRIPGLFGEQGLRIVIWEGGNENG